MRPVPYVWAKEYESAILELDTEKITVKVEEAETAIQQREAELLQKNPTNSGELDAIARASRALRVLKEIALRHK